MKLWRHNPEPGTRNPEPRFLVVGLGNPGEEYARSRHNAGFMAVERLRRRFDMGRTRRRYEGRYGEGAVGGRPVAILLPRTFMNRSGEAVSLAAARQHFAPAQIIVVYDDMDFPVGVVRVRKGGGAGGHNGVASIIRSLGSDAFSRVRVGIGRPESGIDPADWVLSPFDEPDEALEPGLDTAVDCVEAIVTDGVETAMNRFNQREAGA